jgi:hypothetical protein
MEKDEDAHQQASCHHGQCQRDPVRVTVFYHQDHQDPQGGIGHQRVDELPRRLADVGLAVFGGGRVPFRLGIFGPGDGVHGG